jgi:hypothetical protein
LQFIQVVEFEKERVLRLCLRSCVHAKQHYKLTLHLPAEVQQDNIGELCVLEVGGGGAGRAWLEHGAAAEKSLHVLQDLLCGEEKDSGLAMPSSRRTIRRWWLHTVCLDAAETWCVALTVVGRHALAVLGCIAAEALSKVLIRHAQLQQVRIWTRQVRRQVGSRTRKHLADNMRTVAAPQAQCTVILVVVVRRIYVTVLTPGLHAHQHACPCELEASTQLGLVMLRLPQGSFAAVQIGVIIQLRLGVRADNTQQLLGSRGGQGRSKDAPHQHLGRHALVWRLTMQRRSQVVDEFPEVRRGRLVRVGTVGWTAFGRRRTR